MMFLHFISSSDAHGICGAMNPMSLCNVLC